MIIGVHNSINGGILNSIKEAMYLKTNALQIFLHSPRVWEFKEVDKETASLFRLSYKNAGLRFFIVHSSYLITPLSSNFQTVERSLLLIKKELEVAQQLDADYYVMHIKENKRISFKEGVEAFKAFMKRVGSFKTKILIENSASGIGSSVKNICTLCHETSNVVSGICLDTAHVFEAGYNIKTKEGLEALIREVGDIRIIKLIHLNDSRTKLNSHIDRHHHIGKGFIGVDGFINFFSEDYFRHLPIILETPKKSLNDDVKNLTVAKRILGSKTSLQ